MYNEFKTKRFRAIDLPPGSHDVVHQTKELNFINRHNMNDERRVYGANNI